MPAEPLPYSDLDDEAHLVRDAAPSSPSGAPGRLVVVRHGTTSWSKRGRHTGLTDVPLEDEGRRQATEMGHRLG
ncbi:MAG: phosphoglycerate mutase family protein, partial [Acidimicrobiales bacterium]